MSDELGEMRRQFNNMLRYNNEQMSNHEVEICHSKVIIEALERNLFELVNKIWLLKLWIQCCAVSILAIFIWIMAEMVK